MPPSQQQRSSRVVASGSRTVTTTTQKRVVSRRRASTGATFYREATLLSEDDDDDAAQEQGEEGSTPKQTLALKEAREQSKNNLRQAWDAIFTRYSQGDHLAAGSDDVYDFGTGEVVEDAGFLDRFIVEDEDQPFTGRPIEIGDYGLPGAIGMGDITESSSEEDEALHTPRSRRGSSIKSEVSDSDDASGDDLLLDSSPTRRIIRRAVARTSTRNSAGRLSRSVSMPDSVDLLSSSSSEDELMQMEVHPVSDRYKEIKRVKASIQEDLKEFIEAENARQAKAAADRVKRERTCTPFLSPQHSGHLRAGSSRPLPRSAPSSYRPYVSSSLARNASVTPTSSRNQQRFPTPSTSASLQITVKPESSSSSLDVKPFRAVSRRPQGRSFSLKPSSSSSTAQPSVSGIPLGHYSNTLHYHPVACDDDSSDDDLAIRTPRTRVKKEERGASAAPWSSAKGKERAKEEDLEPDNVFLDHSTTHLPSPPPSRRKRSPTFFASPTTSTMRPVVEIVRSASRAPQHSRPLPNHQKHPPHTVPRMPPAKVDRYRPKQSSPLKGSSNQLHRSWQTRNDVVAIPPGNDAYAPICLSSDSSDEDEDIPLRSFPAQRATAAQQPPPSFATARSTYHPSPTRQAYTSPNKRKHPISPESPESPTSRARLALPTPPRSFSTTTRIPDRQSPITPSTSLARMSLASSQRSSMTVRRPKEETPDVMTANSQAVRHAESIRPTSTHLAQQTSHLPTPPLSSGSATSFNSVKEETPAITEEEYSFRGPPTPRRPSGHVPARPAAKASSSPRVRKIPAKRLPKEETRDIDTASNTGSDSDDIILLSPSRSRTTSKQRLETWSSPDESVTRTASRVRMHSVVHESKPRRTSLMAAMSPKASPTVTRARPPVADSEGEESDDPLGI
ncbi:hypothetical protein P389DRAFT_211314 [Cystobasidium minutum MCA 4210]|uniref:uncharacterized protein n=1 Tax=Cystobasidium minutum MCA 4210 TaxID=1397322 RepID=UPI0034CDBE4E|eukprot:jgi/Rhomi1/211314/estExt_Genemark1.C_4_t20477